jgi:CheY-like chemotaxis protein
MNADLTAQATRPADQLRILLVADDPATLERLRLGLGTRLRCRLDDAASPSEALALLAGADYRLVICDLRGGVPAGLELFRTLQARGARRAFFMLITGTHETVPSGLEGLLIAVERPSVDDLAEAVRFLGVERG